MRVWIAGAMGVVLVSGAGVAQEPLRVGGEFQVNTYTTSYQGEPAVAADVQGDFVVVWSSYGSSSTDSSYTSIQAQRHDASGTAVGAQFQVNSYTTEYQWEPSVAMHAQGSFVVVWTSYGSFGGDTSSNSVQAQRHDASGTAVGAQFQVNSYTTSYQERPQVAMDLQGNFVVVWTSNGSYSLDPGYSIQAQLHDASGTAVGTQFQVNTYPSPYQDHPAVAADPLGNFVVVWESDGSYGTDLDSYSIQAQLYDASGTAVGGQFQVNTYTTSDQGEPAVAADVQGDFVVVWSSDGSYGTDNSYSSIQAQLYEANGAAVGDQIQVNTYTTSDQRRPAVTADANGNFVVVWESEGSSDTDTSSYSIQGQLYRAGGTAVGGQFQVNTYTTFYQIAPVVPANAGTDFVVIWQSSGSQGTDTSDDSIQGQLFSTAIFTDGFESGDTSAWSSTVP